MLTYSVKPRGGVVHALEVSEALARRGHEVELAALARPGEELFRPTAVPLHVVATSRPTRRSTSASRACSRPTPRACAPMLGAGGYDVVHAQDCLSANAALELRDAGVIDHVIRTVHHVDDFTSPSLVECQDRSILEPDQVLCVSQPWVDAPGARLRRARRAGLQRRRHAPLPAGARRGRARRRARVAAGLGDAVHGADRRRDRAAQGLAHAARGLRRAARRRAASATRCW